MKTAVATTDADIARCYPVMKELRPGLSAESFVSDVRRLQRSGYRLAWLQDAGSVVAVAGFHLGESFAWGRYLYVDDLVTAEAQRSKGYGTVLLSWLADFAVQQGCRALHLDSGVQRTAAHRFYLREGMQQASYHFVMPLS